MFRLFMLPEIWKWTSSLTKRLHCVARFQKRCSCISVSIKFRPLETYASTANARCTLGQCLLATDKAGHKFLWPCRSYEMLHALSYTIWLLGAKYKVRKFRESPCCVIVPASVNFLSQCSSILNSK
jgi:hypothetical protein